MEPTKLILLTTVVGGAAWCLWDLACIVGDVLKYREK